MASPTAAEFRAMNQMIQELQATVVQLNNTIQAQQVQITQQQQQLGLSHSQQNEKYIAY